MAVKPVREVSPWTLGSGVRLRELIQLPESVIVTGKLLGACAHILLWAARHYICTATTLMLLLAWYQLGSLPLAAAVSLLVPAAYWAVRIALLLRAGECATIMQVFTGIRRARKLQKAWQPTMYQLKHNSRQDPEAVPPLVHLIPTPTGVKGQVITGSIALDANKLVKEEVALASGLFCDRVIVRAFTPSIADIRFDWGQHLRNIYRFHELPPVPARTKNEPAKIRFGINADGSPATLISNLSTLIGGNAGSGKSSTAWSIIAGYQEQLPVRLRVVDPSGIEFADLGKQVGNGLVHDYVSDPKLPGARKLEDFWEDAEEAFNRRMQAVTASGKRWHEPTEAEPLDILLIDELLPIAKQLKSESTEHIVGRIAYLGRKAGFVVIALTQASQVDVIGRIRDLFPQRISHRMPNRYMTDAVLGEGAESDGARASQLDLAYDKGVAYMAAQGVRGYMGLRSAWIPDTDTKNIASALPPAIPQLFDLNNKPTALYQFHDNQNQLLYVGIAEASRVDARWAEHARSKPWWCDVARKEVVDVYPDRDTAETAEALTIRKRRPVHNKQHNTRTFH